MDRALLATPVFTITLASCSTEVCVPLTGWRLFTDRGHCVIEGSFDSAEPHLLASGQRDSARLLAQMFVEWASANGPPGAFALRGTVP